MARSESLLLDLPLDILTDMCLKLDLRGLVRVAGTCKRFRLGDGCLETVELPNNSPVVTVLRDHAYPGGLRPAGCSESWVAYLARCARQRRCREAPLIAAGFEHSLFVDTAGRLLSCGARVAAGRTDSFGSTSDPTPVVAMTGVRVRSVAAGYEHSLALSLDGLVYSWGHNRYGQLGHGDTIARPSPALVEGLEGVCGSATVAFHSFAMTLSGSVYSWGYPLPDEAEMTFRPVLVDGFGGVRVRCVCATRSKTFAMGENGELFSWGVGGDGLLGHGDTQYQPSPKRVEALRDVRVSSVAFGCHHAVALAEEGRVYAWGNNWQRALLGNPHVQRELTPKPVKALRGVRVGSVAAAQHRSYAVSDTGEVWAWGIDGEVYPPLGHDKPVACPLPKPIAALRGVKVDAVVANVLHTLALVDDGSVYAWGDSTPAQAGALGLGSSVADAGRPVRTPQRVPALRVACGL